MKARKKISSVYYEKKRIKYLRQARKKYREDAEYRERIKKYYREKYQNDPTYHEKTKNAARERYHTDSVYRMNTIKRVLESRKKLKSNK